MSMGRDGFVKKIAILGSTGSIGTQTLEIVRDNPDLQVVGLAAGANIDELERQVREFQPRLVSLRSCLLYTSPSPRDS